MDGAKWTTFAAVTTSIVLIVSLGFNSFFSMIFSDTNKEIKLGTELSLFAQTYQLARKSAASFFQTHHDEIEAYLSGKAKMSTAMHGELVQMLDDIEFLAWLLNNGYITLKGADEILSTQMAHVLDRAAVIIEKSNPPASEYFAKYYPEITKLWTPKGAKYQKDFEPAFDVK